MWPFTGDQGVETKVSYHTCINLYRGSSENWLKVWVKILPCRRYCRCWMNTMEWWWCSMLWRRNCTCSVKVIKRVYPNMVYGLHSMSGSSKLSFLDGSEMSTWKEWSKTISMKASRRSTRWCWLTRWKTSTQLLIQNYSKLWSKLRNDPRPDTPHHSILSQMDQAMCRPLHPLAYFLHADWKEIAWQFQTELQQWRGWKLGCGMWHSRRGLLWCRGSRASECQCQWTKWGVHGLICKAVNLYQEKENRCFWCGSTDHPIHGCQTGLDSATEVSLNSKEGTAKKGAQAPQRKLAMQQASQTEMSHI